MIDPVASSGLAPLLIYILWLHKPQAPSSLTTEISSQYQLKPLATLPKNAERNFSPALDADTFFGQSAVIGHQRRRKHVCL